MIALALLGASWNAHALALGAISVQSALGEPLRAEIEIPEMSSEQAASLQASIASRKEFQAAGVDYSAALSGAQISLQRRANGQPYLRVLGSQSVNEPFINLVVNANWTNGHLRRDYTVLVNPRGRAALPAVAANTAEAAPPSASSDRTEAATPRLAPLSQVRRPPVEAVAPKTPPHRKSVMTSEHPVAEAAPRNVTVRRGDTATGIARSSGLRGVSLDQMLIALLHSNPKAFIDGNVNLVKAGAVVRIPTTQQARATSRTEARKMVIAQTQDFHAYRQRVAQGSQAKAPAEASAAHEATGTVQSAQVNDQKAQAQEPDRLTVSKAAAKDATVTQVAQAREESAQSDRVAELSKNIQELSRLESAAKTETKVASADKAAAAPEAPANAAAGSSANAESKATPGAAAASTEGQAASATRSTSQPAAETAATAPARDDQPVASAKAAQPEPNSPAIKVKADPPPAAGAQPAWYVSLTDNPNTLGLGAGLIVLLAGLGLYSARRHRKIEAAAFTDADFDDDDRHDGPSGAAPAVADKPENDAASEVRAAAEKVVAGAAGAAALKAVSNTAQSEPAPSALDLNIDMGDDDDLDAPAPAPAHADGAELADFQPTALAPRMPVLESDPIGNQNAVETPDPALPSLDFPATEMQFTPPPAPMPTPSGKGQTADDKGMIDFDLGPLPDHEEPEKSTPAFDSPLQNSDDPLVTKLSLAQEFSNIGDDEGARSLAQEVVANATGELKKRAEDFLAHL